MMIINRNTTTFTAIAALFCMCGQLVSARSGGLRARVLSDEDPTQRRTMFGGSTFTHTNGNLPTPPIPPPTPPPTSGPTPAPKPQIYSGKAVVKSSPTIVNFPSDAPYSDSQLPLVFANLQTTNEQGTADVRAHGVTANSFQTFVQSNDATSSHVDEQMGYLSMEPGPIFDDTGSVIAEAGIVTIDPSKVVQSLSLTQAFTNPVFIMVPNSYNAGADPFHYRLDIDATTTKFKFHLETFLDFARTSQIPESAAYLVVEEGTHTLLNGSILLAMMKDASAFKFKSFDFTTNPSSSSPVVVLSQTQEWIGHWPLWL